MTEHTVGVPNLIELQTPDPDAAAQFYTELFGWRIDDKPPAGYRYARALDGAVIAGLRQADGDQPAAWTVYLTTNDIARATGRAAESDARILHGPVDVPGQGEVAVIADPTGAVTGLWQPRPGWHFASHAPGAYAWAELLTPSGSIADDFYAELVGLGSTQIGDADTYDYAVWTPTGHQAPVAGRHQVGVHDGGPAHWRVYFTVDPAIGTDQVLTNALRLGATLVAEPSDIPAGRIAVLTDPAGAQFALLTPAPRT
ncbi:VOC family protein [Nesterenkonia ebinurensis]|uniref:VOC family protein n=1 Tax=Nesterenkonia ebinurensis TaxID=2608252 RepID=UPI00123D3BA4|nr:VOC family protein [Nesterenkonia ebinurensis]